MCSQSPQRPIPTMKHQHVLAKKKSKRNFFFSVLAPRTDHRSSLKWKRCQIEIVTESCLWIYSQRSWCMSKRVCTTTVLHEEYMFKETWKRDPCTFPLASCKLQVWVTCLILALDRLTVRITKAQSLLTALQRNEYKLAFPFWHVDKTRSLLYNEYLPVQNPPS